ncbi:ATP-binding protein [Sphingosinicella sp. LHD-64]|uniref:sensor histidine kinase n=1 Tax=Sphingosinicella sp. LHD-64 TaxID=3072139 RepID=UPI0028105A66|nr:ATP-binding protein [Sphingosinicella sp. LHD-64]MDQ8754900.1 ATP-binding protein [Sphingosinicella sp. LHD-64]
MRRFLPRSLIGQIALVMAAALLVAQSINFTLLLVERQRATQAQIEGPLFGRFISAAQRYESRPVDARADIPSFSRRSRYTISSESILPPERSDARLVTLLRNSAQASGLVVRDARAGFSEGEPPPRRFERRPRDRDDHPDRYRLLVLSVQLRDGNWVNGLLWISKPDRWAPVRLAGSTLLLYFVLLVAMIWVSARIVRPLRDLASAADRLQGAGETPIVKPSGPADIERAITAFNAMSKRVSAMLVEKDRMLGAIGHDLRTPLASLRIRAESIEPEDERAPMIATIEEMAAMLDDTLALARTGRGVEQLRPIDVGALADTVVEEFRALGQPVELEGGARLIAKLQPNLIRRAVRNLIDNAVKYGGSARVAVRDAGGDRIAIEITDDGPGIPDGELANAQEAFYRIEPSRSRETGGSGLGLTLARAAAQAHGGGLELANRPEGGLVARILLPRGTAAS